MKLQPKMVIPVIVIASVSFAIYWVCRSDNKTDKRLERYHRWKDANADREMDIAADSERRRRRLSLPNLQRRRAFDSMMVTDPATGLAVITATGWVGE